jgi:hypothetical protein
VLAPALGADADAVQTGPAPVDGIQIAQPVQDDVVLLDGRTSAGEISDPEDVFELLWLLLTAVLAWVRPRNDLVLDGGLGFAPGTRDCGFWLAGSVPGGAST